MNMLAFDTHAAVKRLTAHGLTEEQAESIVSVIGESADQRLANLATKDELDRGLERTENRLEKRITEVETKLDAKMDVGFAELRGEILSTQNKLILWMLGSQALLVGTLVALANFTKLL